MAQNTRRKPPGFPVTVSKAYDSLQHSFGPWWATEGERNINRSLQKVKTEHVLDIYSKNNE